jgi:diguanylate cyclase (GGDEF)-like protein
MPRDAGTLTTTTPTPTGDYALGCELVASVTSSLELEDVLATVAQRIAEALDVWECDLFEYYADSETLVGVACWARQMTPEDYAWVGTRMSLSKHPTYRPVVLAREIYPCYADDEVKDPMDGALMETWGELATLAVPLVFEDTVIGAFTLIEKERMRRFSEADKRRASLLAIPAAVAIHNARMYHQEEEQNRHLASLLDSSRALTSAVELEEVLDIVCRKAAQALDADEGVIYEYDAARDAIVYLAKYIRAGDVEGGADLGTVYSLEDYPSDRALLTRGEVVEESLSDEDLPADARGSMEKWGELTCLNVPLICERQPVGILMLTETTRERHFGPNEIELAKGLGEQAAVAIHNAQLYRRQERGNKRLLTLLETSRVLASSLDTETVLAAILGEVVELFGVPEDAVGIVLRDPSGEFRPFARSVSTGAPSEAATAPGEPATPAEPVDTEPAEPIELDDLQRRVVAERIPAQDRDGGSTRLLVPLVLDDVAEGLIEVRAPQADRLSDEEVSLLRVLTAQAAAAMVNARLYQTLHQQAVTDGLTGLYNHRHFYERLAQECARAQRYQLPLSLLMLDIDDFKRFNDRFGHPVGDLVLAEVGRILTSQLRRNVDLAARYGGEEFVVLLPNTPQDGARVVGDRLLREMAKVTAAGDDLPPQQADGARTVGERIRQSIAAADLVAARDDGGRDDAHVTVSVGIAAFPGAGSDPDELVRAADKALYLAKRLGKNRVEVYLA